MQYEAVIGIEIHCELKTKTKMFSSSPLGFAHKANTLINEVDLAHPGSLPQVNKEAVNLAVKLCQALNCDIDPVLQFDRKNYFYSDLAKGYQITQQFYPLGRNGSIDIYVEDVVKNVRINRLHLEEDTAKQFHEDNKTLIDFNRAGAPLVEIVTEADFRNGKEAASYVDAMRLLVTHLGVSDGKMSEGSIRCDVNISLRPKDQMEFGTKVEIKNLNSIANIEKAIDYEIERQANILDSKESIVMETRRFDESSQKTVSMRSKESLVDYRYFRDPNIPRLQIPNEIINQEIEETPFEIIERYQKDMGLSLYDAKVLVQNKEISDYFDLMSKKNDSYKLMVNWLTQDLLAVYDEISDANKDLIELLPLEYFDTFINEINKKTISSKQAKKVFAAMLEGKEPLQYIKENNMIQISDEVTLSKWIEEVLSENPQVIEDYAKGLDKSLKFVVGQVMKKSRGQANPQLTNKLLIEILAKKV